MNIDLSRLDTAEKKAARVAAQAARKAELAERKQLKADVKIDEVFDQLRITTLSQINAFVNSTFSGMNAQQRKVIKMLVQVAVITLRELPDTDAE